MHNRYYSNNNGNPIYAAQKAIDEIEKILPKDARIARACSTGYGEALLKAAFRLDDGEVETVAHSTAAAFFDPQTAPHVIALALTDDWKSLRRWRQLERALPDGAMREELAAFHAEIAAGESVRNRGAALNARLGRIAGL